MIFQCAACALGSFVCQLYSDPNAYIDDPNTLENGLFDCRDPNLVSFGLIYPPYWEHVPDSSVNKDCYVALHSQFTCNNGSGKSWSILSPFEGDYFVLLSTEDVDPNDGYYGDNIRRSRIQQQIFLGANDVISGAYFFGTRDYITSERNYNDVGIIYLDTIDPNNNDPNSQIILAACDVKTVTSYGSTYDLSEETNGWISFSHMIEPNQVGAYYLKCQVEDSVDTIVHSYLAIDGLQICSGGMSDADLNRDCSVDLLDYSIISEAWLAFCPDDPNGIDPNDISDPNLPCQLADIDNSWYVDPNDLFILSNDWLGGYLDPNTL